MVKKYGTSKETVVPNEKMSGTSSTLSFHYMDTTDGLMLGMKAFMLS
jgi:hypothetical protein